MISKKTIKKISIIIGLILIILYFGGNLGLYFYIKSHIISRSEIEKLIDYTPEKLKLKEADIEAETLHIMGLKLKFPFYKEDIKIYPHFFSTMSWTPY